MQRGTPIRAIPDDLKTLALNGEKAYREAYDLVHRREADRPNQIWQADHTQLDLWAKRADGETARPDRQGAVQPALGQRTGGIALKSRRAAAGGIIPAPLPRAHFLASTSP